MTVERSTRHTSSMLGCLRSTCHRGCSDLTASPTTASHSLLPNRYHRCRAAALRSGVAARYERSASDAPDTLKRWRHARIARPQ